jgi:transposase
MSPCAEVGLVFSESESEDLCAQQGAPGVLAVQLALVTVVQYMEDLSDWEAAEAVHSRIDLKYLLGVELANEGFDYLVLREFRQRLVAGEAQRRLLDKLLSLCQGKGWLKAGANNARTRPISWGRCVP